MGHELRRNCIFKALFRVAILKETVPGTPLPPGPILTRWGTRTPAAMYYAENFDLFATILNALDEDDAACIGLAQKLVAKDSLKAKLVFIAAHFGYIPSTIEKLGKMILPLTESTELSEKSSQRNSRPLWISDQAEVCKGSVTKSRLRSHRKSSRHARRKFLNSECR